MIGAATMATKKKHVPRWDTYRPKEMEQMEFSFDALEEIRASRKVVPIEKMKFITVRKCLRCDQKFRARWPGLCGKCKRHEDFKDSGDEDSTVES